MAQTFTAVRVRRVGEAEGAACPDCGAVFGVYWWEPVPWSWRKSQAMHERGTGHKMQLIRVIRVELATGS